MIEVFVSLAIMGAWVAFGVTAARWTLWPIEEAGQATTLRTQFTLIDFFALILLLQAPLVLLRLTGDPQSGSGFAFFAGLATFFLVLLWWYSVSAASRAGIRRSFARGVFVAVLAPVTFAASLTMAPSLIALASSLGSDQGVVLRAGAITLAAWLAPFVCRRCVARFVRDPAAVDLRTRYARVGPSPDRGPDPHFPKQAGP